MKDRKVAMSNHVEWLLFGAILGDKDNLYGMRDRINSTDFRDPLIKKMVGEMVAVTKGEMRSSEMKHLPAFLRSLGVTNGVKAIDGIEEVVKEKTRVSEYQKLVWMSGFPQSDDEIRQLTEKMSNFIEPEVKPDVE